MLTGAVFRLLGGGGLADGITRKQFSISCKALGVVATDEQFDALFNRYVLKQCVPFVYCPQVCQLDFLHSVSYSRVYPASAHL